MILIIIKVIDVHTENNPQFQSDSDTGSHTMQYILHPFI